MESITFEVNWPGERNAGINAGSETVTVQFAYGPIDADTVESFREFLREHFDGATVQTAAEYEENMRRMDAEFARAEEHELADEASYGPDSYPARAGSWIPTPKV